MMLTPTQSEAKRRHEAFHRSIAEKAARRQLRSIDIVDASEQETAVPVVHFSEPIVLLPGASVAKPASAEPSEPIVPRISILSIQVAVCAWFGVSRAHMLSARRSKDLVFPRHIAIYLCKVLTARSLPEIGRYFGGRDHTTALHAARKIEHLLSKDAALRETVEQLTKKIEEESNANRG